MENGFLNNLLTTSFCLQQADLDQHLLLRPEVFLDLHLLRLQLVFLVLLQRHHLSLARQLLPQLLVVCLERLPRHP